MAEDVTDEGDLPAETRHVSVVRRLARWASGLALGVLALLLLAVLYLHSPPGRQFIVDQVAGYAPASLRYRSVYCTRRFAVT